MPAALVLADETCGQPGLELRWKAAKRDAEPIARDPSPLSRDEGRVGEPGLPSESLNPDEEAAAGWLW